MVDAIVLCVFCVMFLFCVVFDAGDGLCVLLLNALRSTGLLLFARLVAILSISPSLPPSALPSQNARVSKRSQVQQDSRKNLNELGTERRVFVNRA